ncbi:Plant UBX domain-containing protein 5 [Vitis vinifera]|uniref:Plant UBX domain-containing protein 5 n=1 Tax=Vitis vinifera TaxID=29760 RepID=A0A438CJ74_VITVI|nr:Plant UBX domain-containing protein 5 [Vitis vinifera]
MDDGAKEAKEKESQLIDAFLEISSSSRSVAVFFLESHNWDLDAALSAFLDNDSAHRSPSPAPAPLPLPLILPLPLTLLLLLLLLLLLRLSRNLSRRISRRRRAPARRPGTD